MRHYRDQKAIAEAIAGMFQAEGARVVEQDGALHAFFFDDDLSAPMPVAKVNIDKLAAAIERRLS
ncbi:hypothetical protein [Mycoplana ramosa]|uniref:Dienelactone hydrolase domain-containing protein n=1 Tax=Mycoplana ramosa TaxID=40837 RepID=A0ABW3Z258_MYCRA